MRRVRLFLTAALIATLLSSPERAQNQAGQANQRPLVIRGGLLIDGTGAAPVPTSIITIVNGRIQSVGREGSVTIPADATVIDATGKTVIPGLVDSHVHLRNYHIQDYLYWGVTTVGDLGNSPGWLTAYRDAVEQGPCDRCVHPERRQSIQCAAQTGIRQQPGRGIDRQLRQCRDHQCGISRERSRQGQTGPPGCDQDARSADAGADEDGHRPRS